MTKETKTTPPISPETIETLQFSGIFRALTDSDREIFAGAGDYAGIAYINGWTYVAEWRQRDCLERVDAIKDGTDEIFFATGGGADWQS